MTERDLKRALQEAEMRFEAQLTDAEMQILEEGLEEDEGFDDDEDDA